MRILATALISFAAAVFVAAYFLSSAELIPITVVCLVICALSLLLRGNRRMRMMLITFGLAAGFLASFVNFTLYTKPAIELDGYRGELTLRALDFPEAREYGARVSVKIEDAEQPDLKCQLYIFSETYQNIEPGAVFSVSVKARYAGEMYDEPTDTFTSKGYHLMLSSTGEINEITSGGLSLRTLPKYLARAFLDKIDEIFPSDTRAFVRAILIGDRDELYADGGFVSALKISGIYHIVAVSGMHIAFLVNYLTLLLGKRRRVSLVLIPVIIIYMAMTGFTPSVTRAGIMQIMLLLAPIFNRESDGITSLSVAAFLILLQNPLAIKNIGFQLSFAATIGLTLTSEPLMRRFTVFMREHEPKSKLLKRTAYSLVSSATTSIGASVFSVPLIAVHFGYISIVSFVTNLLVVWAGSLAFALSFAAVLLGFVWTFGGGLIAGAASWFVRYLVFVVKLIASFPFAAIYTQNPYITMWLLFIYVEGIIFVKMKEKIRKLLLPGGIAVIMLCLILVLNGMGVFAAKTDGVITVTALNVGQGQSIVVSHGEYVTVVDCGGSVKSTAGDTAAEHLLAAGFLKIDLLVLTHFDSDHVNGVLQLFERIKVDAIAVPDPDISDSYYAEDIIEAARRKKIEIKYIMRDAKLEMGDMTVNLYAPLGSDSENERGLFVMYEYGTVEVLITGDAGTTIERQFAAKYLLPDIEVIIAGHHGSKYSSSSELLSATTPDYAIISVGYNSYGHPTEEAMERIIAAGAEIYRTDIHGTVTITLEG